MYVRTLQLLGTLSCALGLFNSVLAAEARGNEPTAVSRVGPRLLADLYYVGRGVSLNYERAFQLYRGPAARGLDFAQLMLGAMYILGRGVPEDREAGLAWLQRSMQSNPDAPTS